MMRKYSRFQVVMIAGLRMLVILLIYSAVIHFSVKSIYKFIELKNLNSQIAYEKQRYEKMLEEYAKELHFGQRIEKDKSLQLKVLKETRTYFEEDEEPIFIYDK